MAAVESARSVLDTSCRRRARRRRCAVRPRRKALAPQAGNAWASQKPPKQKKDAQMKQKKNNKKQNKTNKQNKTKNIKQQSQVKENKTNKQNKKQTK